MGDFKTFQVTSDNALDTLAAAEADRRNAASAPQTQPSVQVSRKMQVDTYADGRQVLKDIGTKQTSIDTPLRPGHVIIPGLGETSIDAARAAGLLPSGFDQPAGTKTPANPAGTNTGATGQQNAASEKEAVATAPDATDAAAAVLDTLSASLGSETVTDSIWLAAETGDIEGCTPKGVSVDHAAAIVEGFTAQANAVLNSSTNGAASVEMLSHTLTDAELREARMATIHNDKEKLAHFGKMALGRMETLPYQKPDMFEALIADMPAAERKALTFNADRGEWVVTVPGRGSMPFGSAVRAGIVRIG
ncbi:MAG: hypothetical protein KKB66_10950 [Alphaproteobacteria bacterium]|nr:hypothetical protein [Alphaproteobacteria bacterium]MBU0804918.1 hypothetical protein [Alphaproteobacteria bacterium]MBU0870417.1 hypothetical protein [Alphaproteobacteria bacterium]MBU1401908.1 hypothetical protein [Alphaproteobacteria bacterium]MBU1591675.1 hypothetical protein [Alphaproteobacteria bacterium]